jgi:DNA-binding IclR family transcriptional regulator
MTPLKNTQKVLDTLIDGPKSFKEIVDNVKVPEYNVKNILMELTDGGLVRRSIEGVYRVVDKVPAPKHEYIDNPNHEKNEWTEYHREIVPKLKNLSRIV